MRIVAQRVSSASVSVDNIELGKIDEGLCLLIGVAPDDTDAEVRWMAEKVVNLRIFDDEEGKMNRSLLETGGSILAVSQFTLYADCRRGRRPSFVGAASHEHGEALYRRFADVLKEIGVRVEVGKFGAYMRVNIVNEGPVTIIIDTKER